MESDFQLGAWVVRPQLNILVRDQRTIHLEPKMMGVLVCLAQRSGEVVPKEQLVQEVWRGTFVTDDVLIRCISELRKAFGDNAGRPTIIETIPKRGYRLLLPVVPVACGMQSVGDSRSGPLDSIAVFPFENASGTPEIEYLSDGISESIINSLSRLAWLRVVPRTTIFRYRERSADPIRVGQELRTRLLLTGRVRERDGDLIVDAELIDTARESQVWGGRFRRKVSETIDVMQEIAEEVSKRLQLKLSNHESAFLSQRPTQNREAYPSSLGPCIRLISGLPRDAAKELNLPARPSRLTPPMRLLTPFWPISMECLATLARSHPLMLFRNHAPRHSGRCRSTKRM